MAPKKKANQSGEDGLHGMRNLSEEEVQSQFEELIAESVFNPRILESTILTMPAKGLVRSTGGDRGVIIDCHRAVPQYAKLRGTYGTPMLQEPRRKSVNEPSVSMNSSSKGLSVTSSILGAGRDALLGSGSVGGVLVAKENSGASKQVRGNSGAKMESHIESFLSNKRCEGVWETKVHRKCAMVIFDEAVNCVEKLYHNRLAEYVSLRIGADATAKASRTQGLWNSKTKS